MLDIFYKTKSRKIQSLSALIGTILAVILYSVNGPAPAMLVFCAASFIAWVVSSNGEKYVISLLGIVIIFLCATLVINQHTNQIMVWFTTKLVFVVYFGVFIGHVASGFGKKYNHWAQISLLLVLMTISFVLKYPDVSNDIDALNYRSG
jgi:phosphoglycerol transferase MdoB-like AlkP superfamily enzyme